MKRIVMMEGGVETLSYFSHQMAKEFERMGYPVFFYDLKNEEQSARKLRKFLKMRETVLVTFNFQGLEQEPGVYKEGTGYIWDTYQMLCFNIAADHPYFYHEHLRELPKDYRHISIDRFQELYFKEFYPEFTQIGFLPLAGTELCTDTGQEKRYDVIFTGNYTELSFFEPYIHWINDEYAAFYQGIIDELIEKPYQTVEAVALAHCEREMGREPNDELRIALSKMIFIDLYVRNYWRGKAVCTLVNAGIPVDVVGEGWKKLPDVQRSELLRIHPQTDSLTCLSMIQQARISLNVMPWFKDGAHDRIFNSILNGAVCVSDPSRYLGQELKEGEGVCYYTLEHLEELPDKVKDLLQNEKKMQDIMSCGREKVRAAHIWAQRAKKLAEWIEGER